MFTPLSQFHSFLFCSGTFGWLYIINMFQSCLDCGYTLLGKQYLAMISTSYIASDAWILALDIRPEAIGTIKRDRNYLGLISWSLISSDLPTSLFGMNQICQYIGSHILSGIDDWIYAVPMEVFLSDLITWPPCYCICSSGSVPWFHYPWEFYWNHGCRVPHSSLSSSVSVYFSCEEVECSVAASSSSRCLLCSDMVLIHCFFFLLVKMLKWPCWVFANIPTSRTNSFFGQL